MIYCPWISFSKRLWIERRRRQDCLFSHYHLPQHQSPLFLNTNLLSPQSIMWDRTLWCLTWIQTINISQNSLLSVIATELKIYYGRIFFVNFGEKWVRFETKEKKSLKFHFIWDFWWPILETERFVPYLGELKRD